MLSMGQLEHCEATEVQGQVKTNFFHTLRLSTQTSTNQGIPEPPETCGGDERVPYAKQGPAS
jgi:hypothetical protein